VRFRAANRGAFLVSLLAACFTPTYPLQDDPYSLGIAVQPSQTIVAGQNFSLHLVALGGFLPYSWSVSGELPPGLKLHSNAGTIAGTATTPGEYHFELEVTDSNIPEQRAEQDVTIIVVAGITMAWKQPPGINSNTISGSLVVTNQTGFAVDLTVIVVAVNSIGRATALGYQHFTLAAQSSSPEIPFSSSPGLGTYFVRADAAAHRNYSRRIYRASKQTDNNLQVTQF
jgi:hypothetical protein